MNLILFELAELIASDVTQGAFTATVDTKDRRYVHCTTILKVDQGAVCRVGIIGGLMYDATVLVLTPQLITFTFDESAVRDTPAFADLNISLILAMPRPKVLDKLWPVFSQLGFRRVMLINAERVEKSYFHTHVIQEHNYRPKLVKGLEQASVGTRLPEVDVDKRTLDVFVAKRLDVAFPNESCNRFICHPDDEARIVDHAPSFDLTKETVIALGPEGGWLDFEIDLLRSHGFLPVTCSSRVFTTDVALIALTAAITSRLQPAILGSHI
jgi:RsmE family RNA methyltransferase